MDFTPLLIGLGCGLVIGIFVARASAKKDKLRAGGAVSILHYLASALFASGVPSALASLLMGRGIGTALIFAFGCIIASYLVLLPFAALEFPARARKREEDEGWTAQKARESGL